MDIVFIVLVLLVVVFWLGLLHHREKAKELLLKYDIKAPFYTYPWGEMWKIDETIDTNISTEDESELRELKTRLKKCFYGYYGAIGFLIIFLIANSIVKSVG